MLKTKKYTLQLPVQLVETAMLQTRQGITSTVRKALEVVAAWEAYDTLKKFKGKYKYTLNYKEGRADRK